LRRELCVEEEVLPHPTQASGLLIVLTSLSGGYEKVTINLPIRLAIGVLFFKNCLVLILGAFKKF
jgi:hypothetical protein